MVGQRIKQARLASGLTLEALAEKMATVGHPITKAGLSKYELSKSVPRQAFLVALASVLGVRAAYFLEEGRIGINWIAFRKLSRMTQKKQEQVKAFAAHVVENQMWLQTTLFPNQKQSFPHPRKATTLEDAEAVATELRKAWKLGVCAIDSLTSRVEDNGGVVVPCGDISEDFDGLAGRTTNGFPIAVVATGVPDDRRRYNLAHELGHLLMSCEGVSQKDEERLANRFASALLVPAETAKHELGAKRSRLDLGELGLLKRKYGFSMQGWIRRAFDLEIIDQSHYKGLHIQFSRNHWKKSEPVQFVGKEQPSRLKQMTLRALSEGLISAERAEQVCLGCTDKMAVKTMFSAADLRRMPKEQRNAVLMAAAEAAHDAYENDRQLTDFEAFGEDDLYDDHIQPD